MTLGELIDLFRSVTHDVSTPPMWSDDEITEYANDAEREACRRARLLVDSTSYSIDLSINEPMYTIDPKIIFIRRVKLASQTKPLPKIVLKDLDENMPGWEGMTGNVLLYCTDIETGKIRFIKTPIVADTVSMTVIRLPNKDMVASGDTPEIKAHYHRSLINWMCFRGYSKQNADTVDKTKADIFEARFTADFGLLSSAMDESWIENNHGIDGFEGLA